MSSQLPTLLSTLAVSVLTAVVLFPSTLDAQTVTDRELLQSVLDGLDHPADSSVLQRVRCKEGSVVLDLCDGLVTLRTAELTPSRDPYDKLLRQLEGVIQRHPTWPWAWYELGLTRSAMSRRRFVVKETPIQAAGTSYRRAAMDAFAQAIRTDSTFAPAAVALAGLILAMEHGPLPKNFHDPLASAVGSAGAPAVLLSLFRLEYAGRQYPAALHWLCSYLEVGGDTGLAHLERARVLQALGDTAGAAAAYLRGVERMGEDGRLEYRSDLAWIATDSELATFDALTPTDVPSWMARFWQQRDALELRKPGERLAEHIRRWVYVHQNYLVYRPDDAPIHAEGLVGTDQANTGENFGVVEAMVLNDLTSSLPGFKLYTRKQWEIDDRGVIYLRHGPPTRTAIYPAGPPNESWQYDMPDGSRIFHFLGSRALGTTAATTLVASLPLTPGMLDSRGNLDSRYTALADDLQRKLIQMRTAVATPNSGIDTTGGGDLRPGSAATAVNIASRIPTKAPPPNTFHPETAYREVLRGRSTVAVGVSTDGFPLRFKGDLDAVIQAYGVGFGDGQTRRILAVFGVPGRRLLPQARSDGGPGLLYPISIRIVALDKEQGITRRWDTTRTFLARDTLRGDQHLVGLLDLAVPPGRYQLRALVSAPGVSAATATARDTIEIPISPTDLTLSDLILGRTESGLTWNYNGKSIPLNPLNAYPAGSDAALFYEIAGLVPGMQYKVTMAVRKVRGSMPQAEPLVRAAFEFSAAAEYQGVDRGLGLNNLNPGAYLLEVTVDESGSGRRVTRRRPLNILGR